MKRRAMTLVAMMATAMVAGGAPATAAQAQACAGTAVFQTDGYGNGETLANWNRSRFNAAPPAGWQIVQVPYYAGVFPIVDRNALDASVAEGTAKLEQAVTSYHRACPGTRLVLAGYSEGAVVAGDVLERFARTSVVPHHLLNGVLYGNPRRDFGYGGAGGVAGGIETNVPTILPGVTMKGGQRYGSLAVRNICNENDGICNSTNMITNLAAFANGLVGYAQGDHGYDLNPHRDLGRGDTLHRQPHRIAHGAPLPLPIGTPWQIQQLLGGNAGLAQTRAALNGLAALIGQPMVDHLSATSPWFMVLKAA
ncbi:cutinase family protein [Actinokineospora guangxiensis]|uniref:Cutinase family protein n=1 Tax=Actinokineospora guangxiensis TaxID=1490288 RepID=A0ABW0EMC7_9PSEU